MVRIEQRRSEWVVLVGEELMSLHPSRPEAERAALWLARPRVRAARELDQRRYTREPKPAA
jgi:hypothetical protein